MNCPKCNGATKVVDRRSVRRRRECLVCNHRFSTIEMLANEVKKAVETVQEIEKPKPKPPKPKKEKTVTIGVIKRNADARRKIEELRERKRLDEDFDFMDDDFNYLPEKW